MNSDIYSQFLAKKSTKLNQVIEELKKLEAYAVCAKDTHAHMQQFVEAQRAELQNLLTSEKISNEAFEVSVNVLRNTLSTIKSIEDESVKSFYMKLGVSQHIKQELTELVNERALQEEAQTPSDGDRVNE